MPKYVSEFQIDLALMSILGSLDGIRDTEAGKATKLTMICPECTHVQQVSQGYTCPDGHGPFKAGACARAREVNKGEFVKVDQDAVKEVSKSELPPNVLELTVHHAEEVAARTFPGENAYVFVPKKASKQYGLLMRVIADPNLAFIGLCNLKNFEKLLRLEVWDGSLVVQTLMFPEEVKARPHIDVPELDEKYQKMTALFDKMVTEFDPNEYRNVKREKLTALVGGGLPMAASGVPKPTSDETALDNLKAMLEAKAKGA